jgi:hypothetical protein
MEGFAADCLIEINQVCWSLKFSAQSLIWINLVHGGTWKLGPKKIRVGAPV